jgi:hypothetical protein
MTIAICLDGIEGAMLVMICRLLVLECLCWSLLIVGWSNVRILDDEKKDTLTRAGSVFLMFLDSWSAVESTPHVPHFRGGGIALGRPMAPDVSA